MKKKSKIYKNYMNRKIVQLYMVKTLQLFPLCLWTMLQHVKVGHISLSQMVIFIFGLKTPHLIYLGPGYKVPVICTSFFQIPSKSCACGRHVHKKNHYTLMYTEEGTCTCIPMCTTCACYDSYAS